MISTKLNGIRSAADAAFSKIDYLIWRHGRKKVAAAALAVTLPIIGLAVYPYAKTAYQKHKAEALITEADKQVNGLAVKIMHAKAAISNNRFIMTEPELDQLNNEIYDSDTKKLDLDALLAHEKRMFTLEKYEEVRHDLDETRVVEKGATKPTVINRAIAEQNDLEGNVLAYCRTKRDLRDNVWKNERFLKARLHHPMPLLPEAIDDIGIVGDEFIGYVPIITPELQERLALLAPELNNSLGENLERHRARLEHILKYGIRQPVQAQAQMFFDTALASYLKTEPENDKLEWYRPRMHDGKWVTDNYKRLLGQQTPVVNSITAGDNSLNALAGYHRELHDQWFEFVSEQHKEPTTFRHSRTDCSPTIETDADGNMSVGIDCDTVYFNTDGFKFYFTTRKVTPMGAFDTTHHVGDKDEHETAGYRNWSYSQDQEVGYLLGWKRLHDDNAGIVRGGNWQQHGARILELDAECKK